MKKNVPAMRLVEASDTAPGKPELPEELAAVLGDIAGAAREGLLALSVAAGMAVMQAMFEQEISEAVGFTDSNYFSRQFHRVMGVSPREYRRGFTPAHAARD